MKKYNLEDRRAARQARRDAVLYLKNKKRYSWKAIAYAMGITPWRAELLFFNEIRKRGDTACTHHWNSGNLNLLTASYPSLTCIKCGRIEYLNHQRKWTEAKAGTVRYPAVENNS